MKRFAVVDVCKTFYFCPSHGQTNNSLILQAAEGVPKIKDGYSWCLTSLLLQWSHKWVWSLLNYSLTPLFIGMLKSNVNINIRPECYLTFLTSTSMSTSGETRNSSKSSILHHHDQKISTSKLSTHSHFDSNHILLLETVLV